MADFIEYIIPVQLNNAQVYDIMRAHLGVSASLLRSLKQVPMGITLDGEHVTVRHNVRSGQTLRFLTQACEAPSAQIVPVEGPLDIIFEDDDILILCKPTSLPVHPSRGHFEDTLANRVAWYYKSKGTDFTFRAVNRLDRGTSGLLCIAKNQYASQRLCSQLSGKSIRRLYQAVVEGLVSPPCGVIDLPIGRLPGYGIKRAVMTDGQRAVTHYKTIKNGNCRSLLEIELETGRTHQIRVHFSHMGHPVAGDFMYGTELEPDFGHALHSCFLALSHPRTSQTMSFSSPTPAYFQSLLVDTDLKKV